MMFPLARTRNCCNFIAAIPKRQILCNHGIAVNSRSYYDDETNKDDDGNDMARKKLSARERALYRKARPRLDAYRARHVSMPDMEKLPKHSLKLDPNTETMNTATVTDKGSAMKEDEDAEIALYVRKKRLLYRCLQRGWLEVDLLLGTWASQNVMSLSIDELNEFEDFVNSETIDIYNIITLRLDTLPEKWKKSAGSSKTGIVERIQEWAKTNPLGKADPEKYKEVKESAKLI
jgi:succinate dehydrogenase assembly factor 2